MEITWLGHSSLLIRSGETTLIADPYDDSIGFSMGRPHADAVTVSHNNPHHAHWQAIQGNPRILSSPGEYEVGNFYITGIGTNRGEYVGKQQLNTAFTVHAEALTLCHLGDLGHTMTLRQVDELGHPQILFVPVGSNSTIDIIQMVELIEMISPRIVVPFHYFVNGPAVELDPLQNFLRVIGEKEITRAEKLRVTATSLPLETRIVILELGNI